MEIEITVESISRRVMEEIWEGGKKERTVRPPPSPPPTMQILRGGG